MTVQSVDRMRYNGEELPCSGWKLKPPNGDPRVPRIQGFVPLPTSMLRGYEAVWAVREDRLYLESIWGEWSIAGENPVFADWVTEEIGIELGPVIGQQIWGPIHERTLFVQVAAGIVCGTREVRNEVPPDLPLGDLSDG